MSEDMNTLIFNPTKARLDAGRMAMMATVRQTRSVDIVLAIKAAGYDGLYVDLEHGGLTMPDAGQIFAAALIAGITPLVRVPGHEAFLSAQALDMGAMGIIAPHVNTAKEAAAIVANCKYPPEGTRSLASTIPQLRYMKWDAKEVCARINSQTMVVPQIESAEGVDNVEGISGTKGVDALLVGTNDLMADMGIPGQHTSDKVLKAFEKIIAGAKKHGVHVGIGGISGPFSLLKTIYDMGAKWISAGTDTGFLAAALKSKADEVRKLEG